MTVLQDWAIGLCVTAIGLSLINMLAPQGNLKKTLLILASLLFFCCLIAPLKDIRELGSGWIDDLEAPTEVSEELTRVTDEQIKAVLETTLWQDAEQRLSAYDLTIKNIYIKRDTTRTDSIYIEGVTIVFDKSDHPISPDVYNILERAWGVAVEVRYVE